MCTMSIALRLLIPFLACLKLQQFLHMCLVLDVGIMLHIAVWIVSLNSNFDGKFLMFLLNVRERSMKLHNEWHFASRH